MDDHRSNSELKNILSEDLIKKNLITNKEYAKQLDKIVTLKGKLVVYLSIIYGVIIAAGLIYLFLF